MATGRQEFLAGVRAELPLLLGVVPFGLIFGVLGLSVGLPGWAVVLSSSLIFGGSSQVVFAQLWGAATPPPVMVTTVGVVNLRHLLYSAAVADYRPKTVHAGKIASQSPEFSLHPHGGALIRRK